MARAARLALADMRATQKQMKREEMHGGAMVGGAFHGAGMVGAGATPSMGLSQFRGGMRGCGKKCKGCEMCMNESSSDEEGEMHGGAWYSSALGALGIGARAAASSRAAQAAATRAAAAETSLAVRGVSSLVPYSSTAASRSLASRLASLNSSSSRALTTRTPGTIKPYNPAEAAYRLGTSAPGRTMASRLASMGITPARVAMALAAGVTIAGLADYFANEAAQNSGDAGYYDDDGGTHPGRPVGPVGDPDGTDGTVGDPLPGMSAAESDMYLRTGNIPYRYLEGTVGRKRGGFKYLYKPPPKTREEMAREFMSRFPQRGGPNVSVPVPAPPIFQNMYNANASMGLLGQMGGRSMRRPSPEERPKPADGRRARAEIVRRIMSEKRLSLPMASKYVKENGLY